ncbi:sulfatase-like hydrolase/transferase [uncultured Brevibacillus sp.]|uniref:sulfatase-like hydrolase/transferase n=1 Tax=uncultured Brevibacillus sp. TaxID=169970 RepID=UPI0025982A1A|nr:sulfatase-like hydrolase/transferase [uncultured Brevibacillus sp.]
MLRKPFYRRPNILFIMVDEERYPPVYEEPAITAWKQEALHAHSFLRRHGLEFTRHYVGATACSPSRATLFTGQYPSLHGVSQTTGAAKRSADSDMFWLDRNTVPTMGEYFRAAGYRTFYKGKWHFSDPDIWIPGTHIPVRSYTPGTGVPDPDKERLYLLADRLDGYGFSGWIGPEPHGMAPHNSGSSAAIGVNGRDVVYRTEVVQLIQQLEQEKDELDHPESYQPWLLVASFVNPHDIVLYGDVTAHLPFFRFHVDDSVPDVPPPPTHDESLVTKPRCQASYRDVFPQAFQPISNNEFYRRLYFQLQHNADQEVMHVLEAISQSSFYNETIIIFTSDHGELLGAHGNLHQKFYCAYEESIHVPFIIHSPILFPQPFYTDQLTSHVDILPTLLSLIGADTPAITQLLRQTHSEARHLVGRDLTPLILGEDATCPTYPECLYFMTEDDVTKGQHQVSVFFQPYDAVIPPNRIETVITRLYHNDNESLWKYSRYSASDNNHLSTNSMAIPDEYELYNLTSDPLEAYNLASPVYATPHSERIRLQMEALLQEQREQKRLTPR